MALVLPALDFEDIDAAVTAYFQAGLRPLLIHAPNGGGKCTCGSNKEHKVGKHPIHKNWQKPRSFDEVQDQLVRLKYKPNVGILLGVQRDGEYVVAIDVDSEERLKSLEKELGELPQTARCDSGRGYRLLYELGDEVDRKKLSNVTAFTPKSDQKEPDVPGVDVKVKGGQIVVAPSLHANGKKYSWSRVGPIATLPSSWAIELVHHKVPEWAKEYTPQTLKSDTRAKKRLERYLDAAIDRDCYAIVNAPEGTRNNLLYRRTVALLSLSVGCNLSVKWGPISETITLAAKRAGLGEREIKRTISSAEHYVRSTGQVRVPVALTDPGTDPGVSSHAASPSFLSDDPLSLINLQDDRGAPAKIAGNVARLLSEHPIWRGGPTLDTYSQTEMWPKPIPEPISKIHRSDCEIVDADHSAIQEWLMTLPTSHRVRVGKQEVFSGVHLAGSRQTKDLLKQWVESLPPWDRTKRLDRWTSTYLGCEDIPYTRTTGRAWLVAAIERALVPGVNVDVAPVLEGPQRSGKNRALETLFAGGPAWAPWLCSVQGDALDRPEMKRIACGRWILHDDEMRAREPKYLDAIKSWHSRTQETYRIPYAKEITVALRRGLLVTSTNLRRYLHDDTGNRRWWPWATNRIDIDGLARDRLQLLAEAFCAAREGERWRSLITDDVYKEALDVAEERRVRDPLLEQIDTLISKGSFRGVSKPEKLTTQTIGAALGYSIDKIDRSFETRVGAVMRELGYRSQRSGDSDRTREYMLDEVVQVGRGLDENK